MNYAYITQLVKEFQDGNRDSFDKIYSLLYDRQYFYVYKMMSDPYAAEDIVQEAFIRAYKNLPALNKPQTFIKWLGKITYNCMSDYRHTNRNKDESLDELLERKSSIIGAAEGNHFSGNSKADVTAVTERLGIRKELDSLSLSMRSVVILKYYDDYNETEIAGIMNIPVGTVKSRLSTAREKLSSRLLRF